MTFKEAVKQVTYEMYCEGAIKLYDNDWGFTYTNLGNETVERRVGRLTNNKMPFRYWGEFTEATLSVAEFIKTSPLLKALE